MSIRAYLSIRPDPRPRAVSAGPPGITVLVPTYTPADADRCASLALCLRAARAAAHQAGDLPLAFLVIDNGLSPAAARRVGEMLIATGCPHRVISVPRSGDQRYTAARARNAGLEFLAGLPYGAELLKRYLLFLDDDTALAPHSLARLRAALDATDDAVAACPRVIPVADLAGWLDRAQTARAPAADQPRRLAGPLTGSGYDLLSVTSHGSLVTGRVVGLLVRLDPVLRLIRANGPLFYEHTPHGSSEDMLVMAVLSRLGELWRVPAAEVADEARRTPGATRRQQFAWGYDHAWLAKALAEADLLESGVHVLDWQPDGAAWEQARADWGAPAGFLINPAELRLAHQLLTAICADQDVAAEMFGARAAQVAEGTRLLGRVLARWHADAGQVARGPRTDLPPLGSRGWASLRDGMDALIGHIAGNVAGSLDNCAAPRGDDPPAPPEAGSAPLPRFFLYGARQPAAAEPAVSEPAPLAHAVLAQTALGGHHGLPDRHRRRGFPYPLCSRARADGRAGLAAGRGARLPAGGTAADRRRWPGRPADL